MIDIFYYNHDPYVEGNDSDWEFTIMEPFPIEKVVEISLQVRDTSGRLVFPEKLLSTGAIKLTGRTVFIEFPGNETKNKPGTHNYGLDLISSNGRPFATIAGKFPIINEINRR